MKFQSKFLHFHSRKCILKCHQQTESNQPQHVNTLRQRQNGRYFTDDIFKCIFLNKKVWISLKISLKFVPMVRISNIPALVQIMAWRRPGNKPLSESMMISLQIHICVTRPQWVKKISTDLRCGEEHHAVFLERSTSCSNLISTPRIQQILKGMKETVMLKSSCCVFKFKDQSRYAPSQWQMSLHCNDWSLISKDISLASMMPMLQTRDIDGLVQDCSNSIANSLELLQCCAKSFVYLQERQHMFVDK